MAPNPRRTEYLHDEIDLLALAERGLSFLKKYRLLFLVATLLGIGWAGWKYMTAAYRYQSTMLVHPNILTNQENIELIDQWNLLLKKGEYAALAKTFNTNPSLVKQVFEIKGDEIQKVFTPTNPNGFIVAVSVRDNAVLPKLQEAIIFGFENSGYVPQRINAKKSRLQDMINKTTADIAQLDTTRATMSAMLRGTHHTNASMIVDNTSLEKQRMEMNEKLSFQKEELQFASAVQVLQQFQPFEKPVRTSWMLYLAIGLFVSWLLAYLIAMSTEINSRLKQRTVLRQQP